MRGTTEHAGCVSVKACLLTGAGRRQSSGRAVARDVGADGS